MKLIQGECLEEMAKLPAASVDLILSDLPYGTTQNKWDSVIPLDALWKEYWRIAKPSAAVVLTSSQPFTSVLLVSQLLYFKHEWIWWKNKGSNYLNTGREPMKEHESVLTFARKSGWTYNKQMQDRDTPPKKQQGNSKSSNYGAVDGGYVRPPASEQRVPSSVQKFDVVPRGGSVVSLHPTQKPVLLMEYLIRTYTNPGDLVLDNCMGSGTTGVAAVNLGRDFIGIEREETYFKTAEARVNDTLKP